MICLRKVYYYCSKLIIPLFFDKKYLVGRWYQYPNLDGYKWCWKNIFPQKILRKNGKLPIPFSDQNIIGNFDNLIFDTNDLNNFQHFGCYFQNYNAKIILEKGVYIAPNVGIITENHDLFDLNKHQPAKEVRIGKNSWIGMNTVILPGVVLGSGTIVGAGSVVTKSFPEGHCVIAGNPAKLIRKLEKVNENFY